MIGYLRLPSHSFYTGHLRQDNFNLNAFCALFIAAGIKMKNPYISTEFLRLLPTLIYRLHACILLDIQEVLPAT